MELASKNAPLRVGQLQKSDRFLFFSAHSLHNSLMGRFNWKQTMCQNQDLFAPKHKLESKIKQNPVKNFDSRLCVSIEYQLSGAAVGVPAAASTEGSSPFLPFRTTPDSEASRHLAV